MANFVKLAEATQSYDGNVTDDQRANVFREIYRARGDKFARQFRRLQFWLVGDPRFVFLISRQMADFPYLTIKNELNIETEYDFYKCPWFSKR